MEKSDLTVLTVIENDPGLFELMVRSIMLFTKTTPKFIICDNTNGKNKERIIKSFSNYLEFPDITIVGNTPNLQGGSNRHGSGLNKIFPLVDTPKAAIVESDCVVLQKGWDDIAFPDYKMVAAKKGELAGQPYYHICFMVFSTGLLKHSGTIDFRPGKDENRGNRNYKSHEDVGWGIRTKVKQDQVQLLDFIDCKNGNGKIFDGSFQSDELHLNGTPICAHFGRGSNLGGKAIRNGFVHPKKQLIKWKEIVEDYLRKEEEK